MYLSQSLHRSHGHDFGAMVITSHMDLDQRVLLDDMGVDLITRPSFADGADILAV